MPQIKLLQAALKYQSMGFSVIPVKQNKKPYIKWDPYQTKAADEKQLRSWWGKWENANIGIVTGKVSNLIVLDADSHDGQGALSEFIPETLTLPLVDTPRGFHNWFAYQPGLRSGPSNIKDCDIKTDGGYIIAAPSKNGEGQGYTWLEGLKITDVSPAVMPEFLFKTLQNGSAYPASVHTRAYNKERMHSRTEVVGGQPVAPDHKRPRVTTSVLHRVAAITRYSILQIIL